MVDRNRMLQFEANWENLLNPPAPPPPRPLSPLHTTEQSPLHLFIPVSALRKVIDESLLLILENRATMDTTPEEAEQTDEMIEQRLEMNKWLREAPGDHAYFALYPVLDLTVLEE